ncbi:glycosyltransferase involved in cell wall biosynthesis [Dysgonomonas sp. PFB1-18]|uniref:glycosyltransferase family 4 protein n=1 Tax=unclassified Dysgonomonas TaxID=2630389 RepID=UPI00247591EB|nr:MULTISPECIES: glycosyltransferase [unclassified Dysgonomonas]MDH6308290.1 glycosyltransferase involved in cell wall biosynthesis [Dysgonomonas sp. PF1-14]MDH6338272.1 glycosyltransferase involved in cell wall biosynthesis [Dysgonomonas sp. PF1-16]MDH6379769.1 glycosyltransferase involved in cell wall biosynthesis [Dysgonomonas sp. PFB1-18]MDH6397141.1 glycosyltransferase involved in cell wall biosynthesis [Dysgonomonas sp. PF1-23]
MKQSKQKLFFWQNTNSIHQAPFFRKLSEYSQIEVWLIVCEPLSRERILMGWQEPALNNTNVLKINKDFSWRKLIDNNKDNKCIHIFSGIGAFPSIHKAFKYACASSCRIAILSESLDMRGVKGFLRNIRGYCHYYYYDKYIEFILAIGWEAKEQFKLWGYNQNKIVDWIYTMENSKIEDITEVKEGTPFRIIYVGSLYTWKGYDLLIRALDELADIDFIADLYCVNDSNIEKADLIQNSIKQKNKIRLQAFLKNDKVRKQMSESDLLILPSRYDGWGAVVSEALMEGTPVMVGYNCGSAILLQNNEMLGNIIEPLTDNEIKKELEKKIIEGKISMEKRLSLKKWAEKHISAEIVVEYFRDILVYIDNKESEKPNAPWIKK